jgi:hypothetical protein
MAPLVIAALPLVNLVLGHGLRSTYLEILETRPGIAFAHLNLQVPDPALSWELSGCQAEAVGESSLSRAWRVECPGPLAGRTLTVRGLGTEVSEAVVDVSEADGQQVSRLLRQDSPQLEIPTGQDGPSVAYQYLKLGIWHIATGADHLTFLLLLVLVVRRPRAVLLAESAFTLSHSLSFSATALGWLQVPSAPAEACIALSLVLLALDVGRQGWGIWRGAGLALAFGLVHGLGFAGGLREIGIPEHAVAPALVAFGLGVEVGQVAFLAVALAGISLLSRLRRWPQLSTATAYLAAGMSSYWLIQRVVACFATS